MRVVVATLPGVVELNWQWLPTWLGLNTQLKAEVDKAVREEIVGKVLNEETLEWAHEKVVEVILSKYSGISGLREFFEALKNVNVQ